MYNPTYAWECPRYAEETHIQRQDQPWPWSLEAGTDHDSLEMCDHMTMATNKESSLLPREDKGFNPVTPSSLTVAIPEDMALLTAQEALLISTAFPYAWGRLQEPLSERIRTNDPYRVPLYQPSVRLVDPDQKRGESTAAGVIKTIGADPKFVSNRAVNRTDKAHVYKVAHHPERGCSP